MPKDVKIVRQGIDVKARVYSCKTMKDLERMAMVVGTKVVVDENQQEFVKVAEDKWMPTYNPNPGQAQTISTQNSSCSRLNFVITGTLSKKRSDFEQMITDKGYYLQNSVYRSTDYLVVGMKPGGSKVKKAQQFGIKVIQEKELIEMLGGN
jgi:NAD-dependent DNA ligase